jgi:hypothetical protein
MVTAVTYVQALKPPPSKLDKPAFSPDRVVPDVSSQTRKSSFSKHLAPTGVGVAILVAVVWGWNIREEHHVTTSERIGFLNSNISLACVLLVAASGALGNYVRAVGGALSFRLYERLFALWHTFHLPFCFLLFAVAAVYVLAVHLY